MVDIERDLAILFVLGFHWYRDRFAESLVDTSHGALVFRRQGFCKRILENILDSRELPKVVSEPVVVLEAPINSIVELNYLIWVEVDPRLFRRGSALSRAEPLLFQFFDDFRCWGLHDDL